MGRGPRSTYLDNAFLDGTTPDHVSIVIRNYHRRRERPISARALQRSKRELEPTASYTCRMQALPPPSNWYHSIGYVLTFLGGVLVGYLLRFMKRGTAELLPPPPDEATPDTTKTIP